MVRCLSKKREDAPRPGAPAWTTTFGDLMNLLLCFFVMLFSMSTIDESEWEELKKSFNTNNTSFLSGGFTILENSDFNNEMTVVPPEYESNGTTENEGEAISEHGQVNVSDVEKVDNLDQSLETIQEQKKLYLEKMYEEVEDMLQEQDLGLDTVNLEMDADFNYIMMTLSGTLLFDSASIEIKDSVEGVLSKIGDILLMFSGYQIEIIGHTDNVPVSSNKYTYKDNNELSSLRALSTFYYLVNKKGLDPSIIKYSGRGEYDPIASNDTKDGRKQNRRVEIKIYNELSKY